MNIKAQQLIGKVKLGAKRNAPELLLGLGLVTGTACIITASRATVKANEKHKSLEGAKMTLVSRLESGEIDEEAAKVEVSKLYRGYALSLAKEYAVPVGLYAATVASIFASYKIQKNRQMALSAALAACTTAYSTLVGKLKHGAEHGLTAEEVLNGVEVKEHVDPETGEVISEKVQGEPVQTDLYRIRFDRYSPCWEKDKFQNECTLKSEENWANDKLRVNGFLFLNEVYDRLGLPQTMAGQVVGWLYNGDGDGYVSFGIEDASNYDGPLYDRNAFDLNFNVDGDILNKFTKVQA